jgi:choice-of-anchor B domain-containing protein
VARLFDDGHPNPRIDAMLSPRRWLIAALLIVGLAPAAHAQVTMRNFELKAHFHEYPAYSACWSYIHSDGREYAILGTSTGTAIYNVTDPANTYKVGFIPGANSQWREMKSYRNWIYVTTEQAGTGPTAGVQIISMVNPESPVLVGNYTTNFVTAHTIAVDTTRALLFVNGTRSGGNARGMHILSLANPPIPTFVARWPAGTGDVSQNNYIHDCVPMGNRLYASSIYAGIERVFDITNPATPTQIVSWTYPGAFSHNSWPAPGENVLYVTDEVNGERLKIFDISNVLSPQMVNGITSNPGAIVHNAHVRGNELFLSNYTEGIRILDIADPVHPAEFAWADSWPGSSGGFHGVWEVCPYFPSGTVIASDIETGLYVYRPVRDYGVLRVKVVDSATQLPVQGAMVRLTVQGDTLTTPNDGIVQFGPNPGLHTVLARKFGWTEASVTRAVVQGVRDTVVLAMTQLPTTSFTGTVKNANTQATLEDADVSLSYTPLRIRTNVVGDFAFNGVPENLYELQVRRPGSIGRTTTLPVGPGATDIDVALTPTRTWDALETATAWVVGDPSDNAISGIWVRGDPVGTGMPQLSSANGDARYPGRGVSFAASVGGGNAIASTDPIDPVMNHEGLETDGAAPGDVQPELDRSPPPGTQCFFTGQGTDPTSIGQNDVDNGKTTLTSPLLDLSTYGDPVVTFWRWFYANDGGDDDKLEVLISNDNGANWTSARTIVGIQSSWVEETIRVADYVPPTSQVRLRFVANDDVEQNIVEAAIDDLATYDASDAVAVTLPALPRRLAFAIVAPNPARGSVALSLDLPASGWVQVELLDVAGRRVVTLYRGTAPAGRMPLTWEGRDELGRQAPAGLYFARATTGQGSAVTRLVRVE